MGEVRASMAFTDPPYNVAYGETGGASKIGLQRTIRNDDLGDGLYDFLLAACRNILSHTDGAVYIFMACAELHTLQRAFFDAGGHWSNFIIWAKNTFTLGRSDYQRQYEPILFGCPNQGATMYRLGPGTIVWLCTLCIDVNRRNVDPRQGLGDAWQTYVNAGDIFGEFQSRSPALPASTCGFRHRRGCEEFSAPGSRRRVPRKPGGMRLPPVE